MTKLIRNKTLLVFVVIVGFAWAFTGLNGYSVMAGALALAALFQLLRVIEGERNWKAIAGALEDYEEIIGGQLWCGKDAEVLVSDRVDDPTRSERFGLSIFAEQKWGVVHFSCGSD